MAPFFIQSLGVSPIPKFIILRALLLVFFTWTIFKKRKPISIEIYPLPNIFFSAINYLAPFFLVVANYLSNRN